MADEKPFDCVWFMRRRRTQISRQLARLTPDERVRWIRDEAEQYRRENPVPPTDGTRKSA